MKPSQSGFISGHSRSKLCREGHFSRCPNIDFYEVTATRGERTVEIRKIAQTQEPTEWAQGIATPRPGEYLTQPQTYRVTYGESVTIASYASARKWEGRPRRYSSYA